MSNQWFVIAAIGLLIFGLLLSRMFRDDMFRSHTRENFEQDDSIDKIVSSIKNNIINGNDKRKWRNYVALQDGQYYKLYREGEKTPLYVLRIDNEGDRKRYRVFKDGKPVNTDAKEISPNSSHLEGDHAGDNSSIRIHHDKNRVDIRMQNNRIQIKGLGSTNSSNLPYPWYYGAPVVYTNGGQPIGLMESHGDMEVQRSSLPVRISVPEKQSHHLPLFLQTYALLHEHISKKNV